jgi:hypothetical protein
MTIYNIRCRNECLSPIFGGWKRIKLSGYQILKEYSILRYQIHPTAEILLHNVEINNQVHGKLTSTSSDQVSDLNLDPNQYSDTTRCSDQYVA